MGVFRQNPQCFKKEENWKNKNQLILTAMNSHPLRDKEKVGENEMQTDKMMVVLSKRTGGRAHARLSKPSRPISVMA